MTRSGINKGLAVSAVAALATVGLPAAAHAAPALSTDVAKITVTATKSTASVGQTVTYNVVATNANGGQATGDLTVAVAKAVVTGGATTDPITLDGNAGTDGNVADKTWDDAEPITLAGGKASFTVSSSEAGTVSVNVSNGSSVAGSSTLTVASSSNKANDVTSLDASTVPSAQYLAEAQLNTVNVTPLVSGNVLAPGASFSVNYSLTGPAGSVPDNDSVTLTTDAVKGDHAEIPLSGISEPGVWTLTTWVDQTKNGGTPGKDAGEPSTTTTITVAADPANPTLSLLSDADHPFNGFASSQLSAAGTFPNDAATTVQLTGVLRGTVNGTANTVVKNASVGVDIAIGTPSATNLAKRTLVTTDSKGQFTVSVPVTAAQAASANAADGAINVAVYLSESANVGDGSQVIGNTAVATPAAPAPQFTIAGAADGLNNVDIQAAGGGTINVPVTVTDQFGRPVAGVQVSGVVAGGNVGATIAPVKTDATGLAVLSYTDKSSDIGDVVTVTVAGAAAPQTATIEYVGSLAPARVTILDQQSPAGTHLSASSPTPQLTVNADKTSGVQNVVMAQVVNAAGTPLVNTAVTVTVDNGLVGDAANPKNLGSSITVKTNANGYVTVGAGSFKAGSQTITISAGAAAPVKAAAVNYVAAAAYGFTTSSELSLTTGGTAKVVATVTDKYGNPVKNTFVTFTQSGVGALAGGVSTASGFTAADGTVSATLEALNTVGAGKVVVSGVPAVGTPASDALVAASTGDKTVSYTVSAPAKPPVVVPPTQPKPAAITKLRGHSVGKKDVLVISAANANGKKVVVKVHGHKVGSAIVKGGKAYIKVKDHNGKKATKYSVRLGSIIKAFKVK